MPSIPWKKAKAKAISKFVIDRLQSSKHGGAGGSLVVETGFPTSVVDLFVKNRDRLKKPPSSKKISKSSSKKPTLDLIRIPIHPSPSAAAGGGNPPPSTPTPLLFSPPDSRTPATFLVPPTTLVQPQQQQQPQEGGDDVCQGDCDSTMLFMAMLKMFFVVLLAFATSKFVVGITLSAFLLLFMEYAGKHLCRLFFSSSSSSFKSKRKPKPDDDDESPRPPPPLQCMCMINKSLSSLSLYKSLQCFISVLGLNLNKRNLFSHQDTNGGDEYDDEEEDFKAPPPPPPSQQQQDTTTTTPPELTTAIGGYFHEIATSAPTSTNLVPHPPKRRKIPCVASEPDLLNWANREQQHQAQEEEEDGRNNVVLDKEAAAYTSCDDISESCLELKKRTSRRYKIKSKIKRLVSGNLKNKKRIKESSVGGNKAASLFSRTTSLEEDKLHSMMSCSSSSSPRRMEHVKYNQQFGTQCDDDRSMSSCTADSGICFSNELSRARTEDGTTASTSSSVILLREEEEEKMKPTASKTERRNSSSGGYLIFFAMVLVGLVGGRALAIAFTLSWCLLLKSCGILKPRSTKCVADDDDDDASSSSISS